MNLELLMTETAHVNEFERIESTGELVVIGIR